MVAMMVVMMVVMMINLKGEKDELKIKKRGKRIRQFMDKASVPIGFGIGVLVPFIYYLIGSKYPTSEYSNLIRVGVYKDSIRYVTELQGEIYSGFELFFVLFFSCYIALVSPQIRGFLNRLATFLLRRKNLK